MNIPDKMFEGNDDDNITELEIDPEIGSMKPIDTKTLIHTIDGIDLGQSSIYKSHYNLVYNTENENITEDPLKRAQSVSIYHTTTNQKEESNIEEKQLFKHLENSFKEYLDLKIENLKATFIQNQEDIKSNISAQLETSLIKIIPAHQPVPEPSNVFNCSRRTNNIHEENKRIFESSISIKEEVKEQDSEELLGSKNLISQMSGNDCIVDFVNIQNSSKRKINSSVVFIEDICGICSGEIIKIKYQCLVCENLTICDICERKHSHPVIKFKGLEISTIEDAMILLESFKQAKLHAKKYFDIGVFDKTYKVRFKVLSRTFSMRPNTKAQLYFTLINDCKNEIPSGLIIMAKYNKDLKVSAYQIRDPLPQKATLEIILDFESNELTKLYDFELFCFHKQLKVDNEKFGMKVDVNNDEDEEQINLSFAKYPKLICTPKEAKNKVMKILNEGLCSHTPYVIYSCLIRSNFNLELALNYLLNIPEKEEKSNA